MALPEEQVTERLLPADAAPFPEPPHIVAAHPAVELPVSLGIAPAQVRLQDIAHQVVGKESFRPAFDERQAAQSGKEARRCFFAQHCAQQSFMGRPSLGT